jgi:hypothetical protein
LLLAVTTIHQPARTTMYAPPEMPRKPIVGLSRPDNGERELELSAIVNE